jgi:hypothetical protein
MPILRKPRSFVISFFYKKKIAQSDSRVNEPLRLICMSDCRGRFCIKLVPFRNVILMKFKITEQSNEKSDLSVKSHNGSFTLKSYFALG